ncbi:MAG: glycogen synthase, partial [Bacteroidetes bacterium]|nr:glycogen synthase [Bacteroidota bacterium]
IKNAYREDPLFANSKVVFSMYDNGFDKPLDGAFKEKLLVDGVSPDDVSMVTEPTFENLTKLAATYSDGLVQGSETLPDSVLKLMKDSGKPTLNYLAGTEYVDEFSVFYDSILND